MSILDSNSNYDSVQEMPGRAAWLDNASSSLLKDNSYFQGASRRSETPAWLGKVDFFDSSRATAVADDTTPVETPPVETPVVDTPPVETPPVETPPVETPPVGTAPTETPPVVENVPPAAEVPAGPRAVEGPPPPGSWHPVGIPGNGTPDNTGVVTDGPISRSEDDEHHTTPAGSYSPFVPQYPGPDGKNADGTYGAGHHPYTPATPDAAPSDSVMTEHHRPALEPEAPYVPPQPNRAAAIQALLAAMKNQEASGVWETGNSNGAPGTATVDPNWVPAPGSFGGGLHKRGG